MNFDRRMLLCSATLSTHLTCCCSHSICQQEGRFGPALLMLQRITQLMAEDMIMDARVAKELKAFVDDAYAFYYYARGK